MDLALIQQILSLISPACLALGSVYHVLRNKQVKSHADLSQKIQDVQTTQVITNSALSQKLATAQSDVVAVAGVVQSVLPAVQEIVSAVQKSQGDIAQIASTVTDSSAMKTPTGS